MATTAEEELIIRHRFLTQSTVSRGEPPFKRLTKRYLAFSSQIKGNSVEKAQEHFEHLSKELAGLELQAQKLAAVCDAHRREQQSYEEQQAQLGSAIDQAQQDIVAKKGELERAQIKRQHNEEYEALRHKVMQHPSRSATRSDIHKMEQDIQNIQLESLKTMETIERRREQFAVLFRYIEDLQRVMDGEEQDSITSPAAAEPMQLA